MAGVGTDFPGLRWRMQSRSVKLALVPRLQRGQLGLKPHSACRTTCHSREAMKRPNDLRASTSAAAVLDPPSCPLLRILVVDDDRHMRQLNSEVLLQSGFLVDTAENGAVAWDTLSARPFDLLVTDHNMPKLTGVELLRKLHAARIVLPVILATGNLPKAELALFPWIKPAATLLKPYTIAQLVGTVKQVLGATSPGDGGVVASL